MSRAFTFVFIFAVCLAAFAAAQDQQKAELKNLRSASGQTLTSTDTPKLKLKFGRDFKYVGGQTFILYGVARAEQHFFADVDKDGNISRLYWVQFEGYLPDNKHSYDYSNSQKKVNIDGLDFYADAWARKIDPMQGRPDSDGNKARAFLLSKGFKTKSNEVIMQRLVNMTDPTNRNELMIIYLEDLSGTGMTVDDLTPEGKPSAKWQAVSDSLLDRARKNIKLER